MATPNTYIYLFDYIRIRMQMQVVFLVNTYFLFCASSTYVTHSTRRHRHITHKTSANVFSIHPSNHLPTFSCFACVYSSNVYLLPIWYCIATAQWIRMKLTLPPSPSSSPLSPPPPQKPSSSSSSSLPFYTRTVLYAVMCPSQRRTEDAHVCLLFDKKLSVCFFSFSAWAIACLLCYYYYKRFMFCSPYTHALLVQLYIPRYIVYKALICIFFLRILSVAIA